MSNTKTEGFWTLPVPWDNGRVVTLCETHALMAVSIVAQLRGWEPVTSVADAMALMNAVMALTGKEFEVSFSETGKCGDCTHEA